jgi:hypothetical protein
MKKLSLIFLTFLGVNLGFAQVPFTFGPKIAANYSTLTEIKNEKRLNAEYITGFAAGAFGRINLNKFYIQPEVYYTLKGSKFTFISNGTSTEGQVRLHGIDVPVLAGYKLIDVKLVNVRVMGGPVATLALQESKNDLKKLNPENYGFDKTNIGFQAGIGVDVANFTLDVRYESGLNAINDSFKQRNSLFQLSVGLKIL